jgi:hypothetical protein
MDVFWLIAFAGWKAIECYGPHVVVSASSGRPVVEVMAIDAELDEVERAYKERIAAARALIDAVDATLAPWPPDIPRPSADREAVNDVEYRTTFDLACLAAAFALFHEFRHVMLARDKRGRSTYARGDGMRCLGARVYDRQIGCVRQRAWP